MKKKQNIVSVYTTVSQFAFVILAPLLFFIVGGYFVVQRCDLPDWVMGICVALGIIFMIGGAVSYLGQLIKMYGRDDKKAPKSYNAPRDNDYYDDYKDLRK
ncbi:MAG: hypothetical protein K2O14_05760 [Oscillospiraceae bacterium]|nr:hypothetical protein [Oscillospiraceae bacterium]